MSWRFPRRPGGAPPTAGEGGDPNGSDSLGEAQHDLAEAPVDMSQAADPADRPPVGSGSPLGSAGVSQPPVVVPRWIQLVILPLALLGLWALARATGTVLLILLGSSTIALILNPVIKVLVRRRIPRGLAILFVYLAGIAFVGGIGVLLANPVSTQVGHLERDVPHFVNQANRDLASLQRWLNARGINVQVQRQGQTALQTLATQIEKRSSDIVSFSQDVLTKIVTTSFDLVLTFVLSIYLLVYGEQIGDLVRRIMPPGDGTPEDDFPLLVQRAVYGYVRGQFLFSLIMGTSAAIALWIFGVIGIFPDGSRYAVFFGAFYGLMEFIPYIGPIIGPLPAILVALFVSPISAVWVTLLFVALQQTRGTLRGPSGVPDLAADQPDPDHSRFADRVDALRHRRRAAGAADRHGDPPDRVVPPAASRARALGTARWLGRARDRTRTMSGLRRRGRPQRRVLPLVRNPARAAGEASGLAVSKPTG